MGPSGHAPPSAAARAEPAPAGTIHGLLAARGASDPEAAAILSPGRTDLSVGALTRQLNEIREFLNGRGLGRGDRVAVLAGLGPEAAVAALGVAGSAVCIPINPLAPAELDAALTETSAEALLAPTGAEAPVREAADRHGLALLEGTVSPGAEAGRFDLAGGEAGTATHPGPAEEDDVALVLRTSGTTSKPKLVPSTHRQLLARAEKTSLLLGVTAGDRSLCPMPLCYAHGLYSGLITPLAAGGSAILPPQFDEATFLRCLRQLSPTWYTAGATHHQAILGWLSRATAGVPAHSLRFARSGAASLPRATREELEALLGVPVVEAYSSSETGIITANPPHGHRKPGSVGLSTEPDFEVRDEHGSPAPPGVPGEVLVRGAGVFSGYEGDEELNRRSFSDGWFRIGDLAVVDEDGYLTLAGRIDDVINRGGEKVSPVEVERVLLERHEVAEAVVFPVPHPSLGAEVAAAVRLTPGSSTGEADLHRFLAQRLARFKVPRRIVVVSELPKGPTGKPVRAELAERLGLTGETGDRPEHERAGPLEEILAGFWGEALERGDVRPDDDFFQLGGDSLSAVELLAALEAELHVGLGLDDLIEAPTPRRLARSMVRGSYLDAHRPEAGRDAIGVNTTGGRPPLFAVGGRPGYALRTLLVGRAVDPEQPVFGLQPPGMDWQDAGIRTIPQIAAHYLGLVRAVQPAGPYRLLGISFGGLVVFEMAVQLEDAGEEVEFLALVDTEPASCSWDGRADVAPAPTAEADDETPDRALGPIAAAGTRVAAVHIEARQSYVIRSRIRGELDLLQLHRRGSHRPAGPAATLGGGDHGALPAVRPPRASRQGRPRAPVLGAEGRPALMSRGGTSARARPSRRLRPRVHPGGIARQRDHSRRRGVGVPGRTGSHERPRPFDQAGEGQAAGAGLGRRRRQAAGRRDGGRVRGRPLRRLLDMRGPEREPGATTFLPRAEVRRVSHEAGVAGGGARRPDAQDLRAGPRRPSVRAQPVTLSSLARISSASAFIPLIGRTITISSLMSPSSPNRRMSMPSSSRPFTSALNMSAATSPSSTWSV